MIVALTGASGFVGSHIAGALHRAEHRVRALVRPQSRRDHIAPFVAEWCVGEQTDPHARDELVAGADAIIHNAYDWRAMELSPQANFDVNVLGSFGLLEAARQAGVRQFLFVSSISVYHRVGHDRPLDEGHAAAPATLYGAAKTAIEAHLAAYHDTHGMNTSAWRPGAVYGIPPDPRLALWADLVRAARLGQAIDTSQANPITHAGDVANALALALGDESVAGQVYNLVDCWMDWQTVAEIARDLAGSDSPIVDRRAGGASIEFDARKATEWFDSHGNYTALRRGRSGVREYVRELLSLL